MIKAVVEARHSSPPGGGERNLVVGLGVYETREWMTGQVQGWEENQLRDERTTGSATLPPESAPWRLR